MKQAVTPPAIVVVAFNRLDSTRRLLQSILKSDFREAQPTLVISIDHSGDNGSLVEYCREFHWPHGEKVLIVHPVNLGLKKHMFTCIELTEKYGSIVLLEDDLFVSPQFYQYTLSLLAELGANRNLAGFSLFNHQFNESSRMTFMPVRTSGDNYFMRVPCSWGEVFTREQWLGFKQWIAETGGRPETREGLPYDVQLWRESSWKIVLFKYMLEKNKYFSYPFDSYTANFVETGENHNDQIIDLKFPLTFNGNFHINAFEGKEFFYDEFCEVAPASLRARCEKLSAFDFEVDLYGVKNLSRVRTPYLLSRKPCRNSIHSFGALLRPHELNIVYDLPGKVFHLGKTEDFEESSIEDLSNIVAYYYMVPKFLLNRIKRTDEKLDLKTNIAEY